MKRILLIVIAVAVVSEMVCGQTLVVNESLRMLENSQADVMFANEFGSLRNDELDEPFPYCVVRINVVGDVEKAKMKLALDLGTMYKVEARNADKDNMILFLVPSGARSIFLQCGDGCEKQQLHYGSMIANRVYSTKVTFTAKKQEGSGTSSGEIAEMKKQNEEMKKQMEEMQKQNEEMRKMFQSMNDNPKLSESSVGISAKITDVGSLSVNVKQSGADVYVDDKYVGKSPLKIDDVLIGQHIVRVVYMGYVEKEKTVSIVKDKVCKVSFDVELSPEDLYDIGEEYYDDGDYKKAIEFYFKAAKSGYTYAQTNVGYCYEHGFGVKKNQKAAIKWYRKAAENGEKTAQSNLGRCYLYGQGVRKDYSIALELFRSSASQNFPAAQYYLGVCYQYGYGVEKNMKTAAKWYRKAAEQGDADAQYKMGFCYFVGEGVYKDKTKAEEWYRKSAEQGNENAIEKLESYGFNK